MDEPSAGSDEVGVRLYLIGPSDLTAEKTRKGLSAVLDIVQPAAFLLPSDAGHDGTAARDLRNLCRGRGTAFIVRGDLELAKIVAADGIHQCDLSAIASTRYALGHDQILGAAIGRSRHDAICAGEDGADYIAFGEPGQPVDQQIIELVEWWRDLFVLPSFAFAETPDEARKLVAAGVDFIGVSAAIWDDPDGPAPGIRRMQAVIEKN